MEEVARLQPDAIVLDLSMPGMDGLRAIPRLLEVAPHVAIVVFSGFTAERLAADALALGAHRYVEKGTDLVALAGVVREAAAARRAG